VNEQEFDERVLAALPALTSHAPPIPALDLCLNLGLDWVADGAALQASLRRLYDAGKANVVYGRGWHAL
jgi:hypothetical protein